MWVSFPSVTQVLVTLNHVDSGKTRAQRLSHAMCQSQGRERASAVAHSSSSQLSQHHSRLEMESAVILRARPVMRCLGHIKLASLPYWSVDSRPLLVRCFLRAAAAWLLLCLLLLGYVLHLVPSCALHTAVRWVTLRRTQRCALLCALCYTQCYAHCTALPL